MTGSGCEERRLAQWLRRVDQSERYLDWMLRLAREARTSISEGDGGSRRWMTVSRDDGIGGQAGRKEGTYSMVPRMEMDIVYVAVAEGGKGV